MKNGSSTRSLAALALFGLACVPLTGVRAQQVDPSGAVTLVAAPLLVDPDYRSTVLLAVPVENNRHVGVIINRPTGRSLSSLFPEHAPSKMVKDPVYFGGPMLRQAVFAVVHIDHTPGPGSIQMMKELFLATQGTVVDHIIEETPNEARYYVESVAWPPGGPTGFGMKWIAGCCACSTPAPIWFSARIPAASGRSCCGALAR